MRKEEILIMAAKCGARILDALSLQYMRGDNYKMAARFILTDYAD